jgi:hypothetical protein
MVYAILAFIALQLLFLVEMTRQRRALDRAAKAIFDESVKLQALDTEIRARLEEARAILASQPADQVVAALLPITQSSHRRAAGAPGSSTSARPR